MTKKIAALATGVSIAAVGLIVMLMVSGVLVSSQTIQMSGVIASANIGIYSDSTCIQSLTSMDWGTIEPGGAVTRTIYIKNIGTIPLTLSLATFSWYPSTANAYMTVTWNLENYVLDVGYSKSTTITITTSTIASSITAFGVDIVITGTG